MAIQTTTSLTGLVATAYEQAIEFSFQPNLKFAALAQMKKWTLSEAPVPGDQIKFTILGDLTACSAAIPESSDPGNADVSKTQKTITLAEYGKLVTRTTKLAVLSFANIDLSIARLVGDNMGKSLDRIARTAYDAVTASSYVMYASAGSGAAGVPYATGVLDTDGCRLTSEMVRYAFNRLSRENVMELEGGFYVSILHPDVIHDFRGEVGSGTWRAPREYVDPELIYNGEVGEHEGFRHVKSSLAKVATDGASGAVDLYSSYFVGYQAIAYAEGVAPGMLVTGPFDAFGRILNVCWYALADFGALRDVSLFKVFCSSSVGANT